MLVFHGDISKLGKQDGCSSWCLEGSQQFGAGGGLSKNPHNRERFGDTPLRIFTVPLTAPTELVSFYWTAGLIVQDLRKFSMLKNNAN